MWNKNLIIHMKVLFWITMINFIAQVPYFFQLYYHSFSDLRRVINVPMVLVFALFLTAYILLKKNSQLGYWLMVAFLSIEFLFYLSNMVFSLINGYGLFFQLYNPNLILKAVFAIGYLNLFASGYFLFLFLFKKRALVKNLQSL